MAIRERKDRGGRLFIDYWVDVPIKEIDPKKLRWIKRKNGKLPETIKQRQSFTSPAGTKREYGGEFAAIMPVR